MTKKHRSSEQGVALIVVLSLVAVMAMLAMVFFSSTAAESQTSQSQSSAQSAQQLASSAAQIVMAQIQLAGNQTAPGNGTAVAWTSQPGLLRTFTPSGPSTVYKLYSDTDMVSGNFSDTNYAPPSTWKSSPAIYCDLNAPVTRAGTSTSLAYPIADPSVAAVSLTSNLTSNGTTAVPGFAMNGTAPGYSGSNPSPTNNPLPMPVRWLYVLKNGQLTTPSSVDAGGNVTFTSSDPQPSAANPVVGRIAFWADDETCKVNINTAGYAKNDSNYWTYWDTPYIPTRDEAFKLGIAQPWNNEFLRYPGHPATTGLNVVFEGMSLTANQTASLTPRYNDGGTLGGNNTAYSAASSSLPVKNDRLFPTVDEMFYSPTRGATAAGISQADLEARRFFLTATSRAPETTLFDTPRVTTWPVWQSVTSRTPLERLIAFCSTIGFQPFYFMRNSANSTSELSLPSNDALYRYLQTITSRNLPGVGGNFQTKYDTQRANDITNGIGANTSSRDQILTSFFDAIRLANLYDQTATTKYTAANPGWVNYTKGPNGTFTLGRNPTLDEVNLVFTRGQTNNATSSMQPNVIAFMYYQLNIPTVGSIPPALNYRMEVSGLSSFKANGTQIFASDTWSNSIVQTEVYNPNGNCSQSQELGGRTGSITMVGKPGKMPETSAFLTAISTNSTDTFSFTGGNLTIRLFSPPAPSNTIPYQTFSVRFPDATTVPVPIRVEASGYYWAYGTTSPRFGSNGYFEGRMIKCDAATSTGADTVLSVATKEGDIRSRALKKTFTESDFEPHANYGVSRNATSYNPDATRVGSLVASPPTYNANGLAYIPKGVVVESKFSGSPYFGGDWDSGMGYLRDGSYSPKADEGQGTSLVVATTNYEINYFYSGFVNTVAGFFTPNRQIPSPGIFGNIPTGVWRTLLFRPARSFHMGGTTHFGANSPHDMYLLDFFHMPVVEPYAISEPFSTAGKINMNAQMIPFSGYLTRETALRAVLASTRLTAISPAVAAISQSAYSWSATNTSQTRYPLNIDQTLLGFRDRYASATNPRVFLSEAEICNIDLIPNTVSDRANLSTFWTTTRTTGDNARERPYAMLLPRLTTKSNSYTVHVTAQALAPGPGVVGWQEGRGKVLSEWRGAYTIERYVDPNDARFTASGAPNFLSGTQPVGPYYRFRVLGTRRFNP